MSAEELSIEGKLKVMDLVAKVAAAAATNEKVSWPIASLNELVERLYPTMVKLVEQGPK